MGGPTGELQEVVGASVLCPGHGVSHMGTPGVPPTPMSRPWGLRGWVFPRDFEMEILIPPVGASKRGVTWSSTHHPAGKAIPWGYRGRKPKVLGKILVSLMWGWP